MVPLELAGYFEEAPVTDYRALKLLRYT
ncbi:uncharacterized protein METZ01_LOCUS187654 [marine metagenome]|uniref:Uncharacterized protein n=1 Tax=marine metagenome TaxID=408172 RepID=A0A382D8P2_9ZZZZ